MEKSKNKKNVEKKVNNLEQNNNQIDNRIFIIIGIAIVIMLLLLAPTSGKIIICSISLFTAIISYIYAICVNNNILKNIFKLDKKIIDYIFYISIIITIMGVLLNIFIKDKKEDYYEYKEKTSIKENKEVSSLPKEEDKPKEEIQEEKENEVKANEEKQEDDIKTIIMIVLPEEYIGINYQEVERDMKDLGYTNIIIESVETTENNITDCAVKEFTIKGGNYERFTEFKANDEVKIIYWKVKKEEKQEVKKEIIFPKEGSKLAKDLDTVDVLTYAERVYINVDATRNVPKLVKYEDTYITDGVYEYLNYLKELGYKIEITDKEIREPHKGFHLYNTTFKASKDDFSWTMLLQIDDELYVEYEFDIGLK